MYSGKIYDVLVELKKPKSDQGLVLRQTQILRSTRYKNLLKQSNEDLFTQLLNPCLHFTKNRFTVSMHIKKFLNSPSF